MEVALELELDDDVFFADITKQINLLITDEDEHNPVSLSSSLSLQGLYRGNYQESRTPYMMYQGQSYNNIRESSKGTGVFIPRCSQPRKKNQQKKQVRFGSLNPNYKQQFPHHVNDNTNTTTTTTPLASYNNINGQSLITLHDFPNPRRSYRDAASIFT